MIPSARTLPSGPTLTPRQIARRIFEVGAFLAGFWARYPVLTPEELGMWTRDQLIALGPTFVKLGQILSTRPIPPIPVAFYQELRVLQDRVPGTPLEHHPFPNLRVDPTPFRAASVAQVHLAFWEKDGLKERAVLKVRRADVAGLLTLDLDLLARLPFGPDWTDALRNLRCAFVQELDFEREFVCLQVAQRVSAQTPLDPPPRTPTPFACNDVSVVMSYLPGVSIYQVPPSPKIAQSILDSFLTYLRVAGCFHSDPHPGNVAVGTDGAVIWYDLSALLPLPPDFTDLLRSSTLPIAQGDVGRLYEVLVTYGALEPTPGSRAAFVQFWGLVQDANASITELEGVSRQLVFRPVYLTLGRALYSLQGSCMTVDPSFRLEEGLRRHLEANFPEIDVLREVQAAALRFDRALQRIDYVQRLVETSSGGVGSASMDAASKLSWLILTAWTATLMVHTHGFIVPLP